MPCFFYKRVGYVRVETKKSTGENPVLFVVLTIRIRREWKQLLLLLRAMLQREQRL